MIVRHFLIGHYIETVEWLTNSPDLNPIEDLCDLLERISAYR